MSEELIRAAVVSDIKRAIGSDRQSVRAAVHFCNNIDFAVRRDANDPPPLDLRQNDRAIAHRDRSLWEP